MFSRHSVQIAALFSDVFGQALPNLCRSFYNETKAEMFFSVFAVALLAEGVDRNSQLGSCALAPRLSPSSRRAWIEIQVLGSPGNGLPASPSSRRAWIEITLSNMEATASVVALLAEGVDRNEALPDAHTVTGQSPSSRRAWIEILQPACAFRHLSVALLAEGVDRNSFMGVPITEGSGRPPRGGRG